MKILPCLLAVPFAAMTLSAFADETDRLAAIEQRLAQLESSAPSRLNVEWKDGLTFTSEDKAFQLRLGGRIQHDWSFFLDADDALEEEVGDLEDGTDFRRIWLELGGTIYETGEFMVTLDFAGGKTGVRNLFVGIKDIPWVGNVRIGSQLEPFSLEAMTANKYVTFIERGLPSAFSPLYNTGIRVARTLADRNMTLSYGLFREADDTGRSVSDDGYNATARITGVPYAADKDRHLLHLGISASVKTTPEGEVRFRSRPEDRISPFFNDTEAIEADDLELYGFEAAMVWGPLSLQGEYVMASTAADDGPGYDFSGYYAQISYFLTGEHRPYSRATGAFGRVRPQQNFRGAEKGFGAWEVAFRVSGLDLNDQDVQGGDLQDMTAAVNWHLNPNMRFSMNYILADLKDVGEAHALVTRFQVDF